MGFPASLQTIADVIFKLRESEERAEEQKVAHRRQQT